MLIPLNWIWYQCRKLAGADSTDTLFLSVIVYFIHAAILSTVWWHLSMILFPANLYVQHIQNNLFGSFKNCLNCWLQKLMSLFARSLVKRPHLWNTDSNCWMTCTAARLKTVWSHNWFVSKSGNFCSAWCPCPARSMSYLQWALSLLSYHQGLTTNWHSSQF